jgi:hypothetical protein
VPGAAHRKRRLSVPIDPGALMDLHEACTAQALGGDVEADLFRLASMLHESKAETGKGFPAAQFVALKRVASLAADLENAIEGLSSVNRSHLEGQYFNSYERSLLGVIRAADLSPLPADVDVVHRISESASTLLRELPRPTGRPAVQDRQVDFFGFIAGALQPAGIKPSLAGPFLALCNAVFLAAAVPFPASALKRFVKTFRSSRTTRSTKPPSNQCKKTGVRKA